MPLRQASWDISPSSPDSHSHSGVTRAPLEPKPHNLTVPRFSLMPMPCSLMTPRFALPGDASHSSPFLASIFTHFSPASPHHNPTTSHPSPRSSYHNPSLAMPSFLTTAASTPAAASCRESAQIYGAKSVSPASVGRTRSDESCNRTLMDFLTEKSN